MTTGTGLDLDDLVKEAGALVLLKGRRIADETLLRGFLPESLKLVAGYIVNYAYIFRDFSFDTVLELYRIKDLRAIEFLKSMEATPESIRRLVHSGYQDIRTAVYRYFLVKEQPDVVIMQATIAGNKELALRAGAVAAVEFVQGKSGLWDRTTA